MASMEVDEDVAAEATSSSQSVAVESSSQAAGNTSNFTAPTSPAPPAQPATGIMMMMVYLYIYLIFCLFVICFRK